MSDLSFDQWWWLIPAGLLGACVGSFLNVAIYRLPLGLSVNEPKRSFCPVCKMPIPMWQNIPLVSWLVLRGRCAACRAPISFRYFGVELLTAAAFVAVWMTFPPMTAPFLWGLMALLIVITFIDAEHLIIPTGLTWAGTAVGLAACAVWPPLPALAGWNDSAWEGVKDGAIGWTAGFFGLWGVVELGKLAFGKKAMSFAEPVAWSVRESDGETEPMHFLMGGEAVPWWDIFSRKSDRLRVQATEIRVDGQAVGNGELVIREEHIELPGGEVLRFESLKSLDGMATSAVIPREAMGMGDVHLLGMIGAFFGWPGVVFALFSSSLFAISAAVAGRIGWGRQLPFGPFLAMGAAAWMFGGWKLWAWYLDFLGPMAWP